MFHIFPSKIPSVRLLVCTLVCLLVLAACGKSSSEKQAATQVAVKVNGDEISVHQVNQALMRVGRLTPEQAAAAGKQILEQLIDQQLLIQKSMEKKLDRDPDVLNALEASRRQILSQAYLEKSVAATVAKPAPEEIKKFYDSHPELFSQRRIYRLQEITATLSPEQLTTLRGTTEKTRNLNEITVWLRAGNIRYSANAAVRAAEQLPQESLPRIAKMKDGDIDISRGEGGVTTVLQMVASQSVPLREDEAAPFIEKYLENQKRTEIAGNEMKLLRQSAKLEYKGDFVKTAVAPPAGTPASAAPAAQQKADPKGAASVVDKGVSGLQ